MTNPYMHPTLTFTLESETATAELARLIARFAVVGDLVRLVGDLGAGKSTFAKHFIQALGHKGEVPSPTYTLVQTYENTRLPVAHVDCYRLKSPTELEGLGLEDYRTHGLILAEWPDMGGPLLALGQPDVLPYHINNPDNGGTLQIALSAGDTPTRRTVTLTASTSWQHRYGLFPQPCIIPHPLARPATDDNRTSFLTTLNLGPFTIEALAPEWSFRSYWRIKTSTTTRILMDAPPPFESVETFANVSTYYASIGLRVASIQAQNNAEGYLLTEDLGNQRLLELVQDGTPATPWYQTCADALITLCNHQPPTWARRYTARDWFAETARFPDWAMPLARGHQTTPAERAHFASLWSPLFPLLQGIPTGLMPWDYQATNMMILGTKPKLANLGLIDIQDARIAPITQDLAILLRDIRRTQDDTLEHAILSYTANKLNIPLPHLQAAVEICNFQHGVRILGGLARSALRDGKWGGAERFMARTWETLKQSKHPALKPLQDIILPLEAPMLAALPTHKAHAA